MNQTDCTHKAPVSWFTLELLHLGELPADEQQTVRDHLDGCEVCRGCLAQIEGDARPALPPLVIPDAEPEVAQAPWWRRLLRPMVLGPCVAAAAAALLAVLFIGPQPTDPPTRPGRVAIKGGDLAISLVRKRGQQVTHDPATFAPGDAFKVEATSPPLGTARRWEVVVFQGDEVSFPLTPRGPLAGGNREPLPGAFSLTGRAAAQVCLVVGAAPVDRQRLRSQGMAALPDEAVCLSLQSVSQ